MLEDFLKENKEWEWSIAFKINLFYYVLTGAIASFYVKHSQFQSLNHVLLLPMFLGAALGWYFYVVESMPIGFVDKGFCF